MSELWLDSQVLLWWLEDAARLRRAAAYRRIQRTPTVYLSIVTPWELWLKVELGKLQLPDDFDSQLSGGDFVLLAPRLDDLRLATRLPPIHRDPFDRLLIAQALNRRATVVTSDQVFARYGVSTLAV